MFQKHLKLAASVFAVLMALAVSGSAFAEDAAPPAPKADAKDAKPPKVKPGEEVEVEDGGTVTVDLSEDAPAPKADAKDAKPPKVKPAAVKGSAVDAKDGNSGEPAKPAKAEPAPVPVMADNFTETKSADEIDTDSMVELAARGVLHPSGPAIGATLGFTWRPANRVRIHAGFDASKGLLELKGEEKELIQFGFTAAVTRVMTRTVEFGGFGAMSWSYRDLVKDVSASFIGVGPGFRLNKAGGLIFFEAAIPIGLGKKFASGDWSMNHALQASLGFHF